MELSDGTDTRIVLCGRSHVEVADHRGETRAEVKTSRVERNETKRNETRGILKEDVASRRLLNSIIPPRDVTMPPLHA